MKAVKSLKSGSRKKASTATTPTTPTVQTAPAAPAAAAKRAETAPAAPSPAKPITIEAKIDVGFGNALFLRGEGKGLSWNHGIPLTCVDGSTWKWSVKAEDKVKFKLLLNDAVWAVGEDLEAKPGQNVEVCPSFN